MPRLTRKSLPEDAPPRGRSRTPAKAAKADTAASSSSSRTAGGKAQAEKVVESKRPGRSASRSKTAAASPAPQTQAVVRGSRSRSRSAAPKEKKTPAPAKRGREKADEEEAEQVASKRPRGRGQSAGKSPSAAGAKRGRGRSPTKAAAPAKSKAKSPAARAASTSRKGKSPAAASPARKGKSPAKAPATASRTAKSPAASKKAKGKSPARAAGSASSRAKSASTSRSPRTPTAKTVGKKKDQAKKTTPRSRSAATPPSRGSKSPRTPATKSGSKADVKKTTPRGRGGAASASTPKGRSRRSAEAVAPQEEAEKDEEEGKETEKVETEQEEKDDGEEMKTAEADVEMKEDTDKDTTEADNREEENDAEMKEESNDSISKEDLAGEKLAEKEVDSKLASGVAVEKEASEEKEESVAPPEAESEPAAASVEATSPEKTDLSASGNAEEPMEEEEAVVASPSEEGQKKDSVSVVSDLQQDNNNTETNNIPSPPHSAVKRKFEEVSEETETEPSAKQARLNGTETEDMEVKVPQSAAEAQPSEEDLLKDYVVVNKDEVPAPDSSEVVASVPAEHKETPHADKIPAAAAAAAEEAKEAEKAPGSSSSGSGHVFVVPLTTAEEIRACAYPSTGHPPEREDMSSMSVEVGSTTDSEILSRNLDLNEELSATVSDVESAADSSAVDDDADKLAAPGKTPESIPSTGAPSCVGKVSSPGIETGVQDNLCSTPVVAKSIPSVSVDENNSGSTVPGMSVSEPVAASNEAPVSDSKTEQPATQSIPTAGDLHNSSGPSPLVPAPAIPPAAAPSPQSMVVPSLGIPDPTFLSMYSSPGILHRAYVPNPTLQADSSITPDKCFSLVSYNILAECNRVKADYSYTGEEFLCQGYRHSLLMKELQYLDGDVVCLQEVNPLYFNNTLLPDMKRLGYEGLMKCRTKDFYDEGSATFFRTSRFELRSSKEVSLTESAHNVMEKASLDPAVRSAAKEYLDRADVVLITCLRCKTSGQVLTIGNVHLWWDDELHPDVKTVQAACTVEEVLAVCGTDGPHIICGDFNSDSSSVPYQLVTDGHLSESSVQALQQVKALPLEDGHSKSLVDHLKDVIRHSSADLKSSYSTVKGVEPELTCYTEKGWTLDYIFYSGKTLDVVGILDIADTDIVVNTGGLPSKDFSSDHLSMKACFMFV